MALQSQELFGDAVPQLPNLRAFPHEGGISVGSLAALGADADVANLTPLSYIDATGFWAVWGGATSEVTTLTATATPATAGTFTLDLNGETTQPIQFDATAAIVVAALELLDNVEAGQVTGVDTVATDLGDANHVVTLTWAKALGDINLTADQTGISAGDDFVLATSTAGADPDLATVDGFLWAPDVAHAGLAAGETLIQVFKAGIVHADDVPLPAGAVQAELDAELKSSALRQKGITMQGISGVA